MTAWVRGELRVYPGSLVEVGVLVELCFFFSSRRRHTRSDRDWSSDVCSSDLDQLGEALSLNEAHRVEMDAALAAGGEDVDDVGVIELGDCQRLVLEALQPLDRKSVV